MILLISLFFGLIQVQGETPSPTTPDVQDELKLLKNILKFIQQNITENNEKILIELKNIQNNSTDIQDVVNDNYFIVIFMSFLITIIICIIILYYSCAVIYFYFKLKTIEVEICEIKRSVNKRNNNPNPFVQIESG